MDKQKISNITIDNTNYEIEAISTTNNNTTSTTTNIYDWIGTEAEWKEQNIVVEHPEWVCYITDDIQDISTELNNPFSLGDSKYSPNELDNISWLASNGQWNSGIVYVDFYNAYVGKIGEDFGLGKIKASTDTYGDYDLVINTTNKTFRLPLLDGSEDLASDRYDDLTLQSSGSTYTAPANGYYTFSKRVTTAGQQITISNKTSKIDTNSRGVGNGDAISIFLPAKKGDIVACEYNASGETRWLRFVYAKGNGTLYFYVGETVQNANLIDAGRIAEQLTTKVDIASSWGFPSNRYINLTLGASGSEYTAPANGYVVLIGTTTSAGTCRLRNLSSGYALSNGDASQSFFINLSIPVKKNDNFNWERQGGAFNINVAIFKFVYAEGAE